MTYHRKSKHEEYVHKGVHTGFEIRGPDPFAGHVTHTQGPGGWMRVPETRQQPKEPQAPTDGDPVRMRHKMATPYK